MPKDFITKQIFIQFFRKRVSSDPFPRKCRQKFIWCQPVFLTAFLTAYVGVLPVPDFGTIWTVTMGPFFHCSDVFLKFFFCHFRETFKLTAERYVRSTADIDLPAAQGNLLSLQKEESPGLNLGCTWFKAGTSPDFFVSPSGYERLWCVGRFARLQEAQMMSFRTHHEISHSHALRKSFFPVSTL